MSRTSDQENIVIPYSHTNTMYVPGLSMIPYHLFKIPEYLEFELIRMNRTFFLQT